MRRQERVRLIYQLRVFEETTSWLVGHLIDISEKGMLVIGERPLKAGRDYGLRMDLPRNVMGVEGPLSFHALCRWCHRDSNEGSFSMGFGISSADPPTLSVIGRLIAEFHGDETGQEEIEFNPPLEQA